MTCAGMSWQECALATKKAINEADSPAEAINAYADWAQSYRKLYEAQGGLPATESDIDRIEGFVGDKIESYTNPAYIMLDKAMERFLPRLAAMLAIASTEVIEGLFALLVPSPTATSLQQAQLANKELGDMLHARLVAANLVPSWNDSYSAIIQNAIDGNVVLPKP